MAYRKKNIPADVSKVQQRISGLKSIEERLDLGNGVSVVALEAAVARVIDFINLNNTKLSEIDQISNQTDEAIKEMNDLSTRALKGVEFKYGSDSNEYEMAGGTKRSEHKRAAKKPETPPEGEQNK
ncbi:MAG: hypothetical protein LUM44_23530 [Pyrinomonadaceae bacterium]|nr:hypothetical protein [Pyrinomonadaceae bacterium]